LREAGEAGRLDEEAEHQGDDAIGPDMAVAHDGELAVAVVPATETVGHIGEAVLMQAASQDGEDGERGACGGEARQARLGEPHEHQAQSRPDDRPGQGESPHGLRQTGRGRYGGHRQAGQKAEARHKVGGPGLRHVGSGISGIHGVVIMRRL
jgi:hypothetical protein